MLRSVHLIALICLACAAPAAAQTEAPSPAAPAAEPQADALRIVPGPDRVPVPRVSANESGLTGLDRLATGTIGPLGTLRLRLGVTHFETKSFPVDGATNVFTGADFALSGTPLSFLELAFAVRATSNANDAARPQVLQSVGDSTFGFKLGWTFFDVLSVAATGEALVMGVVGGGGIDGAATSYRWRGILTGDFLRRYDVPVRFTFALGYDVENREELLSEQVNEPGVVLEWGLQSARYDRVMAALGLEVPISTFGGAFVEYHIGTPLQVELTRRGPGSDDFTFDTVPHWITPGLRVWPMPELGLDFALRLGLSKDSYTGVPSTPPWQFTMGLTYTLDPRPEVTLRTVVEKTPPPPPPATIGGRVFAAATRTPIAGAIVRYPDRPDLSPQVTAADGRFAGYRLDRPGPVNLAVQAEGYAEATATVEVTAGGTVEVPFTLTAAPEPKTGKVEVQVVDAGGAPIEGEVRLLTAGGAKGTARPPAPFRADVEPGRYVVAVTAPGAAPAERTVDVVAGGNARVRVVLADAAPAPVATAKAKPKAKAKPAKARTGTKTKKPGRKRGVRLPTIRFQSGSAALSGKAKRTLDGIAKTLKANPRIKRVRIAAHTDGRGDPGALTRLSNQRARAVKTYLTGKGVEARRLQARGYGAKKPVAPDITASGRARNNRVEFKVLGGR